MRITKAYHGKYIAYRAWFNGKLIWNYGDDTMGDLVAALNAVAKPEPEVPDAVLLQGKENTEGTGLAVVWDLEPALAHVTPDKVFNAAVRPRAAWAVNGLCWSKLKPKLQATPHTYRVIFTRGHAAGKLRFNARPHNADTIRTIGTTEGTATITPRPKKQEVTKILAATASNIDTNVIPAPQEPDVVVMQAATGLGSYAGADTLPVHTVTFMYNGEVKHSARVVHGYGCPDPLTTGDVEKQFKEMTQQHTFDHTGWSLTEDGDPDTSALENITADTVVYAAFTKTIRHYTVRFWDDDKIVDTVSVPYGGTATTEYMKEGYNKVTWVPSNENITGDTDCYGQFGRLTFAEATWEEIISIAESGDAQKYFNIGDRKTFEYALSATAAVQTTTIMIVGFDHDDLADGTGKAAMSLLVVENGIFQMLVTYNTKYDNGWPSCALRTTLNNNVLNTFPAELISHVKQVKKQSYSYYGTKSSNDYVWVPSVGEIGATKVSGITYNPNDGTAYAGVSKDIFSGSLLDSSGLVKFVSRSGGSSTSGASQILQQTANSPLKYTSTAVNKTTVRTTFGFCI